MRHLSVLGALAVMAGAAGLFAAVGREAPPAWRADSCRDAVTTPKFAGPIARARPQVSRLKSAFAAPGLQVAVAVDGELVWSRVCGFADVAGRVPTSRTTLFRIGSVSKTFTAAALARLVQAGAMELDADVRRFVPSFPRKRGSITIAQLASHQSGIRHYRGREALNTVHYGSVTAALRVFAGDALLFPPGSDFGYSSYGFNLLGAALERAGGAPYGRVLRNEVLAPLHLMRTRLDVSPNRGRAALYEVTSTRRAGPAPRVDLSDRYPSGGLVSTAEDVAVLGSRLGDPGFLRPATQRTFFSERRPSSGRPTGYGLGFELGRSPRGVFVGHLGNVVGGTAFLLAHPKSRTAIALLTNIGWVTARTPPELAASLPDPPQLLVPFIAAGRRG
jgi:CubicO group peptidase (beta-lactamase class C family)